MFNIMLFDLTTVLSSKIQANTYAYDITLLSKNKNKNIAVDNINNGLNSVVQ